MKGAQQVASKPSFCGQFIFLEAKKTDSGSLEKCIPNHRTTSEKLFGKRKLSPLLSSKTKRQNNSSLAPDCVDSDNELAFLNDYLVNVDSKESVTSAGDGPSSLIDALDKGVGPAPKTRQPDWWWLVSQTALKVCAKTPSPTPSVSKPNIGLTLGRLSLCTVCHIIILLCCVQLVVVFCLPSIKEYHFKIITAIVFANWLYFS